jgi:hypothetical protein
MEEYRENNLVKDTEEGRLQSASILSNHSNHSSPAKKEIKNDLGKNNCLSKY